MLSFVSKLKRLVIANRLEIILILTLEFILLFFSGEFFIPYLSSKDWGGVDAWSHVVAAEKYLDIFPSTVGWISSWFSGMPLIIGYPPLFYFISAFLSKVLFLDIDIVIKFILIDVYVFSPVIIFYILKKLIKDISLSFFGSLLCILFFCTPASVVNPVLGTTILSTFQIGYYPQALSLIFFLLFIFFLFSKRSKNQTIFLTLTLTLILLTNIHTFIAALVIFSTYWILSVLLDKKKNKKINSPISHFLSPITYYLLPIVFTILLSSFWLIPLLFNLAYLPGISANPFEASRSLSPITYILFPFLFVGIFFGLKNKDVKVLTISLNSIIFLLFSFFSVEDLLTNLPIQSHRMYSLGILLVLICTPISIKMLKDYLKLDNKIILVLGLLVIAPFIFYTKPLTAGSHIREGFLEQDYAIANFMKNYTDGRSLIEVHKHRNPWHYNMSALVTQNSDHETIWSIFRESSLTSTFSGPVRNSLSVAEENFGIICYLCNDRLYDQSFDAHLDRAKQLGVKYFIIKSDEMKQEFLASKRVVLFNEIGKIMVFVLLEPVEYAKTVKNPILTFTNINSRDRERNDSDWLRLSELWLESGDLDRPLVLANSSISSENLGLFNYIFIPDGKTVKSNELSVLRDYLVSGNHVFLVSDNPRLYQNIDDGSGRLVVLEKENPDKAINAMFARIDEIESENQEIIELEGVDTQENSIKIDFSNQSIPCRSEFISEPNNEILKQVQDDKPDCIIYLKSSYHPYWKVSQQSTDNSLQASDLRLQTIYMASPSNTLIFSNSEKIELEFKPGAEYAIGIALSLLSSIFLIIYWKKK